MDFLQEDVDSMERELEMWRAENRDLKLKLKHEEKITEKSIEPLRAHLIELETAVQEQLDKSVAFVKNKNIFLKYRVTRLGNFSPNGYLLDN
jgi:TRAF3-interacting protein 1